MNIRMQVRGGRALDALARRFEAAAVTLPARLEGAVRDEGGSATAEVRSAILGIEVSSTRGGGEHSGLRARAAAATHTTPIPGGVRVEVESRGVDPRYDLVRLLDGLRPWVHPVWGHGETVQSGTEVFFAALRAHGWESGLERVVEQVAREIEG